MPLTEKKLLLKASLIKAIYAWSEKMCENPAWPEMYVGEFTEELMAEAAISVLFAVEEFQKYAVKEGFLKE